MRLPRRRQRRHILGAYGCTACAARRGRCGTTLLSNGACGPCRLLHAVGTLTATSGILAGVAIGPYARSTACTGLAFEEDDRGELEGGAPSAGERLGADARRS